MKNAIIAGTGSYLPEKELTNFDLEKTLDTTDEWIYTRTGIKSRRIASSTETTSFMAGQACKKAIEAANLDASQIDFIVAATCTTDSVFPGVACFVQKALGIKKPIPALDVGAACSGFVYALEVAYKYIQTATAKNILVVGSETLSKAVDWSDRSSCVLFGDGAGAVVLSASDRPGILASVMHSVYDENKFLNYPAEGIDEQKAYVTMQGNDVFKFAVKFMGDVVDEILIKSNLKKTDINWLVPHQANIRIIQAIAKKLSIPMSQVIITIEQQGNTSAASIPLALDVSVRNNRIKRGDNLLFEAFGGGMTWGAITVCY